VRIAKMLKGRAQLAKQTLFLRR